jgi:hypothetical protein
MTASNPLPMWLNRHIDADILRHKSRYTTKHTNQSHVAMLFQGRKIIAIGQNRLASSDHPRLGGLPGRQNTVHAEIDVIRSVPPMKLRGATLVVIRLGRMGIQNSKPCPACQCVLEKCVREYGMRGWIHS